MFVWRADVVCVPASPHFRVVFKLNSSGHVFSELRFYVAVRERAGVRLTAQNGLWRRDQPPVRPVDT